MRSSVRAFAVVAVIIVGGLAPAVADPAADRLFREGRTLMRAGQVAEACQRFASSHQLEPSVGALLNLGDCRERMGAVATAWETFRAAQALATTRRDRRATESGRRANRLVPRLPYLTLVVGEPAIAELVIRRDGVVVDPAQWNQPVPIDPGDHVVEATAPGHAAWSTSVGIIIGQRAELAVELVAIAAPVVTPVVIPPARELPPPALVRALPPIAAGPPLRSLGVGVAVGANHREVPIAGVRVIAGMALPGGALRGTGAILFSRTEDATVAPTELTTTTTVAVGADYLWLPLPQLALAAGLGIGFDRDVARQGPMTTTDVGAWWMVHASPLVVRAAGGHLEFGLHVQVVRAGDEWTAIVLAAADVMIR